MIDWSPMKLRVASILSLIVLAMLAWGYDHGRKFKMQPAVGEAERYFFLHSGGLGYVRVSQVTTMPWPGGGSFDFLGFEVSREPRVAFGPVNPNAPMAIAIVKMWRISYGWLVLVALIAPVCHARRFIRRRLEPPDPNICATCGYDLRATPDRCPECGKAPVRT